jgi:hypothetical protein
LLPIFLDNSQCITTLHYGLSFGQSMIRLMAAMLITKILVTIPQVSLPTLSTSRHQEFPHNSTLCDRLIRLSCLKYKLSYLNHL